MPLSRDVRIGSLALENFKRGNQYIDFGDHCADATVFGANASGKTTIADAWCWLLTGKDSAGSADAEVKPIRGSGEVEHNLETSVAARLAVGGSMVRLRRTLREKWTRKRGSATEEFTGHATAYEVDGVPVPEREWQDRIAATFGRDVRLLCDPTYFCGVLPWRERRRLMLEACGDVADADVIASDDGLAALPAILGGRPLADFRAVAAAAAKKANAELLLVPARIDEAKRSLTPAQEPAGAAIDVSLHQSSAALRQARERLATAEAAGGAAEARAMLLEARARVGALQSARRDAAAAAAAALARERDDARRAEARAKRDLDISVIERDSIAAKRDLHASQRDAKRAEWFAIDAEEPPKTQTCAACGQGLPAERIVEAHNHSRAARKAEVQAQGGLLADSVASDEAALETANALCAELSADLSAHEKRMDALAGQRVELADPAPEEAAAEAESARIEALLADSAAANREMTAALRRDVDEIERSHGDLQRMVAALEANARARERIAELEERQRSLGAEVERLHGEMALCDRFVVAKCDLMESRINARFGDARFRLFERQINGGVSECCEVTLGGVPYAGLNNAARVNVGIACINALSEHLGIRAPIWVDCRESVTDLAATESQVISLAVSAGDENLRVEVSK